MTSNTTPLTRSALWTAAATLTAVAAAAAIVFGLQGTPAVASTGPAAGRAVTRVAGVVPAVAVSTVPVVEAPGRAD